MNSVINEGMRGMHYSQREMQKSAHEVASANVTENSEAKTNPDTVSLVSPVDESSKADSGGDLTEPLFEMRRQEQIFTASAKMITVANEALGSLINVKS
ncbi:MAG: hypothetical protein KTR17_01250 [Cellvibrionaceae bacterium]|nr:hypothetical protein [Cellvibrionaceae bacterium]